MTHLEQLLALGQPVPYEVPLLDPENKLFSRLKKVTSIDISALGVWDISV